MFNHFNKKKVNPLPLLNVNNISLSSSSSSSSLCDKCKKCCKRCGDVIKPLIATDFTEASEVVNPVLTDVSGNIIPLVVIPSVSI